MMRLTWNEFDRVVGTIAEACRDRDLSGVYGVPRGGLPLAVAVSHRLDLPLSPLPTDPRILVLDDIHDSGRTLSRLRYRFGPGLGPVWVWATREAHPSTYHAVLTDIGPAWVLFPWECASRAEQDRQTYEASRRCKN